MDASFIISWKELLIAGIIVLAVYIAELLLLMRSGKSIGLGFWRRRAENRELTELRNKLAALEIRLAQLEGSEDSADTLGEIASNSYGKAFSLAKQGMDVAQVAANCGISRSEAELIVAMQRNHLH
ncbi:MAG: DUF2802 domain-containing protein [Burkholderiales bacterium]|nr:DUF2802 domain-containing protein [Burkholderiales bacterium]